MDTDDVIVVSASGKSPIVLAPTITSPTTPVSAKKLVQARLPFKPLLAVQCATDVVVPKKRKLVDSNANFQKAKNLKKEAEKIVEIVNDDNCVIELAEALKKADTNLTNKCDSACDSDNPNAPSERAGTPVQDENVSSSVKKAETIQNDTFIDLTDTRTGYEGVTSANDDASSCVTSKVSDLMSDSGSDAMDTSTADSEPGQGPCLFRSVEFPEKCESVLRLQSLNELEPVDQTVAHLQLVNTSKQGFERNVQQDKAPNQVVVKDTKQVDPVVVTGEEQLLQYSNSNIGCENEAADQAVKDTQTTPVNKNKEQRKSLDKMTKEERALEKEKKEKEKEEAKLKKLHERQEKEREREKEKAEREKEKAEKEKEKAEKKKQKEDERIRKQEQLLEEKKKKEEAKLEEKKKKEEKKEKPDEKVCVKEKQLMQKFFVKSTKDSAAQKPQSDVKSGPFMEFQVKENMRLAPIVRLESELLQQAATDLDQFLYSEDHVQRCRLYVDQLKNGAHCCKTCPPTWPSREAKNQNDVILVSANEQTAGCFMKAKLFQFHDNYRPAYYGTWRKRSQVVKPRNPMQLDKKLMDYEVDSDEEWEEEEPGESLSHSEPDDDDEEEAAEPEEDSDGFFVPHGYLSEGEGCEDDDDDEKNPSSPGKMKARQLLKARNWEAELRAKKKSEVLHPVVIGICWWSPDTGTTDPLYNKLREFQIQVFVTTPISTALKPNSKVKSNKDKAEKKQQNHKNIAWLPVPDSALTDLARLVHGNEWSIKKLIREFCEFWRCKTLPPEGTPVVDGEKQCLLSKRKLEAKIRQIAVYESRLEYPRRKLWYINADILAKLELLSLPVPTQWKWLTKTFVVPPPPVTSAVIVPSTR